MEGRSECETISRHQGNCEPRRTTWFAIPLGLEAKKTDLAAWEIQQGNGRLVRSEMSLVIFGRSRSSPSFLRRWGSNKATTTGGIACFQGRGCGQIELRKLRWSDLSCCAEAGTWRWTCQWMSRKCNWSIVTWPHMERAHAVCFPSLQSRYGGQLLLLAPLALSCIRRLHLPSSGRGRAGLTPMASPGGRDCLVC